MGVYNNNNGVLSPIAGRGKAEYGASTVRTGSVTIPEDTTAGSFRVTFSDAMPDSNYIVNWYFDDCADGDAGRLVGAINSDANGFWLYYFGGFTKDVIIKYTAFKLYTDTEYNGLIEDVAEIKSDLLYSEIKSSGSISETITANSVKAINIDVAKTGYVPIGIIGIDKTGTSTGYGAIVAFKISNNDAVVTIDNTSTSSITITRIDVTILYKKA